MKNVYLTAVLCLFVASLSAQIPDALVGSCIEPDSNLVKIFVDYSKNCSEADPTGQLAGRDELGFHSGANAWAQTVAFDDPTAMKLINLGNDIYSLTINTMDYYGLPLADIENIRFVVRAADPTEPWDYAVRDETGMGGFSGTELCGDFEIFIDSMTVCSEVVQESSVSLFGPTTAASSCIDTAGGNVTLDFDLSLNCPESDGDGALSGISMLGFHSGLDGFSGTTVPWDDDNAVPAVNNGDDIFSVTINTMEYYGTPLEEIEDITFVLNNGFEDPSDPWTIAGRDERDGGFGGAEPCSDLVFVLAEAGFCDVEPVVLSSAALLADRTDDISCIDTALGRVKIAFDVDLNCPEADTAMILPGSDALGFHSGANDWAATVAWDDSTAMQAVNNGDDVFTVTVDVAAYYGVDLDSLANIKLVMNNGIGDPDNPWDATGRDDRDGGFDGDEPCSDLVFDVAEMPGCDLSDAPEFASSQSLLDGGSCVDTTTGLVFIGWDQTQNCPEADTANLLDSAMALGFHSGINDWISFVPWDSSAAKQAVNDGSQIFGLTLHAETYYNTPLADIENIKLLYNNGVSDPDNPWAASGRDTGGDPCQDLTLVIAEAPTCDLSETATSHALLNGGAQSCIDTAKGMIHIDFDYTFNCPEADSGSVLAGQEMIAFHSGINGWTIQVPWDDSTAVTGINDGNNVFEVDLDAMAYYGLPLDSISEVNFLFNNGLADPDDPWAHKGEDARDGSGFGGGPCSNLILSIAETPACVFEAISSAAILAPADTVMSCIDTAVGRVRIGFDLSLNCPEADTAMVLADMPALGFHSGANDWASTVAWDDSSAMNAMNNDSNIFVVTLDVMEYYGVDIDSLSNIKMVYNNGVADPDNAWDATGRDDRDGGFDGDEPCSDLVFAVSEMPGCDLADPPGPITSNALSVGGSCVDANFGLIKIAWDQSLNCPDADSTNVLDSAVMLGFHSGINSWSSSVPWDSEGAKPAVNNGSNIFEVIVNAEAYYGAPLDSIENVIMVFNNGIANPEDPWSVSGRDEGEGGAFGGSCSDLIFQLSEAPACDLSETATSHAIINGGAASCIDTATGMVRIDFDYALNCPEADTAQVLAGQEMIGFHSGINEWETIVAFDDSAAVNAINTGNDVFQVVIDPMEYYGTPLDSIREINFLFNNGVADSETPWAAKGEDSRDGSGFGGSPCSNLIMVVAEAEACVMTDVEDIQLTQSMRVYPNPFSDEVVIEFDNQEVRRLDLSIRDVSGRLIRTVRNITGERVVLQRDQLPSGMYFAQLRDRAGLFATAKLLVR